MPILHELRRLVRQRSFALPLFPRAGVGSMVEAWLALLRRSPWG